ncbi:hypothetical protein BDP27DRAFT_1366241 [Rhodocollybia butyracea]|uniref:Uncharacterized protein n=1 Tax=Rhodocollybia butyracea TaxID=206335 RepID=A0A9P5U468_9AGAR|nr:hypothetical protein BDP27DRAFT_1366241 [Rhodocollybia butyracea]
MTEFRDEFKQVVQASRYHGTVRGGDGFSKDHLDEKDGDSSNMYDGSKSNWAGGVGVNFSGRKEVLWWEVMVECEVPVRVSEFVPDGFHNLCRVIIISLFAPRTTLVLVEIH